MEIKTNHMVVITPKMNLLQVPIKDKFFVPPSHPAGRATEFAREKGLLNPRQELMAKAKAASKEKAAAAAIASGLQQPQPQSSSSRRPPQTH